MPCWYGFTAARNAGRFNCARIVLQCMLQNNYLLSAPYSRVSEGVCSGDMRVELEVVVTRSGETSGLLDTGG